MLFTFPSRYWFAIGLSGVFSLAGWSRQIRAGLLVPRVTQDTTRPHLASSTGLSPSMVELSRTFYSRSGYHVVVLLPRTYIAICAVWALPRSLATTGGIIKLFSLPLGTKMFQFPRFASPTWLEITGLQPAGLSHSEIHGSRDICSYPWLIAACHVLHRLREPRHPPDALTFFRHNEKLKNGKIEKLKSPTLQSFNSSILIAHTFSCKIESFSQSIKLKVFTYSLVCQYVKELFQTNALLVSGLGLTSLTLRPSYSLDSGE